MSRVMLVCPEPLGHGQPAGIGIRFVEMAKALLAEGHAVTVLSPDGGVVEGGVALTTSPQALHSASQASDVAVVQGHVINDFVAHAAPVPTVIDLYDPFIVENLHYYRERGAEVFTHDHRTLMTSVMRGDLFLCASEAQRLFYLGLLLAVGRLNPAAFADDPHFDELLRIAPFGVQSAEKRIPPARPAAILFGGIYDWYDPIMAIDAVARVRKEIPDATLTFNSHPNPDLTPQGKAADAIAYVRRHGFDFVGFTPWVSYEERSAFFARHALALLTFPQSIETDLSMRTRIYDYLWGGLPVVTSSAPGTDEILERYGAGVVVENESAEALAKAMIALLRDQNRYQSMVAATQQFVRDHQWSQTLRPLLDFCRAPRFDRTKESFAVRMDVPERPPTIIDRIKRRMGGRA